MGLFGTGKPTAQYTRAAQQQRQIKAIAADRRARGDNPVTVSDVRQRHSTGSTFGRILSQLTR